jgi:hypothetical protein
MPWNPSPEVAALRDAARKLGADRAVIVYTRPDGKMGYASYGSDRALCAEAKALAEDLWSAAVEHFRAPGAIRVHADAVSTTRLPGRDPAARPETPGRTPERCENAAPLFRQANVNRPPSL